MKKATVEKQLSPYKNNWQIQDNPPYIMFIGKSGWQDFFDGEMKKLMENPELLQLFMTALAHSNTRTGYDAEEALLNKMREKYGMQDVGMPRSVADI